MLLRDVGRAAVLGPFFLLSYLIGGRGCMQPAGRQNLPRIRQFW